VEIPRRREDADGVDESGPNLPVLVRFGENTARSSIRSRPSFASKLPTPSASAVERLG
jgi:hypothetical protein